MKRYLVIFIAICGVVTVYIALTGGSARLSKLTPYQAIKNRIFAGTSLRESTDTERRGQSQLRKIRDEFDELQSHPWAGEYENLLFTFAVAPRTGWLRSERGMCGVGSGYYRWGLLTFDDHRIHLMSSSPQDRPPGFPLFTDELIPVGWGNRKYLIPPSDMVKFCNDVNSGEEPRKRSDGHHLLRYHDEYAEVEGLPDVPEEYQKYFLKQPVEAQIVALGNGDLATVNVGEESGVYEGLELFLVEPSDLFISATINTVGTSQSDVIVTRNASNDPKPVIGWRFASRSPWARHSQQ